MKALVVDNNSFSVRILSEYLESEGFSVYVAKDAKEGIETLRSVPGITLMVVERNLPITNGLSFIKNAKSEGSFGGIPAIVHAAGVSLEQVKKEGASPDIFFYLTRPFERNLFLSVVRSAINAKH